MATPSERYLAQQTVNPHWISSSSSSGNPAITSNFWYLRTAATTTPQITQFILVEPAAPDEASRRRPAFDHSALAGKLAEATGKDDVDPANLPFRWVEFSPDDLSRVRFRFNGRVWEYNSAEGGLNVWEGEFGTKLVSFMCYEYIITVKVSKLTARRPPGTTPRRRRYQDHPRRPTRRSDRHQQNRNRRQALLDRRLR